MTKREKSCSADLSTSRLHDFSGLPQSVAQRLLGCTLVRQFGNQRLAGIIVEVEAYLSTDDPASHSAKGIRPRNACMFKAAGSLYVYTIHTRHCLNVVTEPEGVGSAVLIRAIEPIEGIETMSRLRGLELPEKSAISTAWLQRLTSGPGRLCQALSVDCQQNGIDLTIDEHVRIEPPINEVFEMPWNSKSSCRIGISQAKELPLRWFIDGHQLVSGCAREHTRGRHWRFVEPSTI